MRRYRIATYAPPLAYPAICIASLRFDRASDADTVARAWRLAYPRCAFIVVRSN